MALCAYAMFTGMDTCIKLLGGRYHVLQVMFLNSLFALLAVVVIAAARDRMRLLWPRHWRLHLARWGVSYLATIAIFSSYPRLALADAYAILFTSRLLITTLSALLLGEHVDWRRWTAVAVGFVGVMVILRCGPRRVQADDLRHRRRRAPVRGLAKRARTAGLGDHRRERALRAAP